MFTGIVEEIGKIKDITSKGNALQLSISCSLVLEDVQVGDSIAVNGICLTVTSFSAHHFNADVMPETFRSTSLATLHTGAPVNLERALPLGGRLGGHLVSGHIDGTGTVVGRRNENNALWLDIQATPAIMRYIVSKGSVCVDGTSLTVSDLSDTTFSISLIPHTAEVTILSTKKNGSLVNVECDLLAKYVEKLMKPSGIEPTSGNGAHMSLEWLQKHGF